jgi:hypothetical protein
MMAIPRRGRISRLIARLKRPQWLLRSDAVDELGEWGGGRARRALLHALVRDRAVVVRRDCAFALSYNSDGRVYRLLQKALRREQNKLVRIGLCFALYRLGESERLDEILLCFDDPDFLVRNNAINGIELDALTEADVGRLKTALGARLQRELHPGVKGDGEALIRDIEERQRR